jgi:hypothetical protein
MSVSSSHPLPGDKHVISPEDYRQALAALERAKAAPPIRLTQEADVAERAVVHMRDAAIRAQRAARQAAVESGAQRPSDPELRAALDHLNLALSLIVSVEYSTTGIRRDPIQQAIDVLKELPVNRDG